MMIAIVVFLISAMFLGRLAHCAAVGGPTSGRLPVCSCLLRCSRWCRSPTASPTSTGSSTATDPTFDRRLVPRPAPPNRRLRPAHPPDGTPWPNHRVFSYVTPAAAPMSRPDRTPPAQSGLAPPSRSHSNPPSPSTCSSAATRPRSASASGKTRRPRVPGDHPLTGPIGTPTSS